jgi:hypothetical protein
MRYLLILFLLPFYALATEDPATKLPLIQTQRYNPTQSTSRGWDEFTDSFNLGLFGNIYRATAMNAQKDLLEELKQAEVNKYFTEAELAEIAARVGQKIQNDILAPGLSNETAKAAYLYGVNEITTRIVDRVMEREGVKDKTRRDLWAVRILAPYNDCMAKTRSYTEAKGCKTAYLADIKKNIGMAMAHELARQELGETLALGRAAEYTECLKPREPYSDSRVQDCVLKSMRTGILSLSTSKVKESAQNLGERKAIAITTKVMPEFERCLKTAEEKSAISACVDSLMLRTGKEIVKETALENKSLLDAFPNATERNQVVSSAANDFEACMRKNIQNNFRETSGQLKTKNCEELVTANTAKKVVLKVFQTSIEQNLGGTAEAKRLLLADTTGRLEACWKSDNKACLRFTTIRLATDIAEARLKRDIPLDLQRAQPQLRNQLISGLETCLKNGLALDLMKASDTNAKIDACTSKLLREAALKVAEFQILGLVQSKLGAQETKALVDQLVTKGFGDCMGSSPSPLKVDECSIDLQRATGIEVGKKLFTLEFDKFVQARGGLAAFQMNEADRNNFLSSLLQNHETCLNSVVTKQNADKAEAALNDCFKQSIRKTALFLGLNEFSRMLKKYQGDGAESENLSVRFEAQLGSCLDEKKATQFDIEAYIKNVDACGEKLTHAFTRELGKSQVQAALQQHLAGSDRETVAARQRLDSAIIGEFERCMDQIGSGNSNERDACTRKLEIGATREIVLAAGRLQLEKELGVKEAPKAIQLVEEKFKACIIALKPEQNTDACVKAYILSMAKGIGNIKFRQAMGGALGTSEFNSSAIAMNEIENKFHTCLDAIKEEKIDSSLMSAVESCTKNLQENAIAFLQKRIENWMDKTGDSPEVLRVKRQMSIAMPCFDAIVPSSPYREGVDNIDPDGILQELSKIIGEYISYDAKRADSDLTAVLAQLAKDLEAAGSLDARRNLIQLMAKQGVLDQLLKSFIRAEVRDTLTKLPAAQRLPPAVERKLLESATFDKVFAGAAMERLRPLLAKTILEPLLVDGKSLSSPELQAAQNVLKKDVGENLLKHPEFGQLLLDSFVQQGIDQTGGVEKFFGKLWYGRKAFQWSHVKTTTHGIAAETYIRDQILRPKFMGEQLSEQEFKRRLDRANELVRTAVKKS